MDNIKDFFREKFSKYLKYLPLVFPLLRLPSNAIKPNRIYQRDSQLVRDCKNTFSLSEQFQDIEVSQDLLTSVESRDQIILVNEKSNDWSKDRPLTSDQLEFIRMKKIIDSFRKKRNLVLERRKKIITTKTLASEIEKYGLEMKKSHIRKIRKIGAEKVGYARKLLKSCDKELKILDAWLHHPKVVKMRLGVFEYERLEKQAKKDMQHARENEEVIAEIKAAKEKAAKEKAAKEFDDLRASIVEESIKAAKEKAAKEKAAKEFDDLMASIVEESIKAGKEQESKKP